MRECSKASHMHAQGQLTIYSSLSLIFVAACLQEVAFRHADMAIPAPLLTKAAHRDLCKPKRHPAMDEKKWYDCLAHLPGLSSPRSGPCWT